MSNTNADTTLSLSNPDPLHVKCVASDSDGLWEVKLYFAQQGIDCDVNGVGFISGYLQPALPSEDYTLVNPDSSGEVPTELSTQEASLAGPYRCDVLANGTGEPLGDQFIATCEASNFAAFNSATGGNGTARATLTVNLMP